MKQMIGAYRYFYNQGIVYLNSLKRGYFIPDKESKKKAEYIKYEGQYLKVETGAKYAYGVIPKYNDKGKQLSQTNHIAIKKHVEQDIPTWFTGLPAHVISQATKECGENFGKIIQNRRNDHKKFSMKFKSKRKSVTETINMEKASLNKEGFIYSRKFSYKEVEVLPKGSRRKKPKVRIKSLGKVYTREPIDFKNNKHEYKIIYNRNTFEYYISMTVDKKTYKNKINENKRCSIDPGEKIFMTVYNPFDREVLHLGHEERNSFNDSTIDKLRSKISKEGKTKGKIKALQRLLRKNENKTLEMHHKIANYLCSNFKHIIVPKYGIKNMKLHSSVNRSMRNLAFYQFRTFLKHKCSERGVKLYVVNESNTTKACCRCGKLNKPYDRDYKCVKCGLEIHRDINGSVNVDLKHVV